MSALTDYFSAGSDAVAATAVDDVDGEPCLLDLTPEDVAADKALYRVSPDEATRPRVRVAQSGALVVQGKGVDPTSLATLEEILTGRPRDVVEADPRQAALIGPARQEEIDGGVVLSVTDALRDALASLDQSEVPQAAQRWASAEFDAAAGDSLALFLLALTDLARRAAADRSRLYCRLIF